MNFAAIRFSCYTKGIKLRAKPEPKIGIDPRVEVLNQDPAKKAGLVQLTILSAPYRLLKIEFH